MTDAIERLWFAHLLLTGANISPDERARAIDDAERLLRDLPPSGSRDDGLDVIEAARGGDVEARRHLANSLNHVRWPLERARDTPMSAPKPRRQRKPSIGRQIAAAQRGGKNVTSITTPDGVTLHFGKSESIEASNPWLDDLKVTKQ